MSNRPSLAITLKNKARTRYELAFDTDQAELYHHIRPGYQADILPFLTAQQPGLAVEFGAGTGLFTEQLLAGGWDTVAVDPAANMLRVLAEHHPEVTTVVSSVEDLDTSPWRCSADLVVAAQSWHWIDSVHGSQKVAELLKHNGVFAVVHHQIDTSIDWVLRLCRIMHSGDVHSIQAPPKVSADLTTPHGSWWRWHQSLSVEQVHHLMMSRAYYLRTTPRQRGRMHDNLQWYLLEHLGYSTDDTIQLPYVTAAWRMLKRRLGEDRTEW